MTLSAALSIIFACAVIAVVCIIIAVNRHWAVQDLREALLECANENREQKFMLHRQAAKIATLERENLRLERAAK